MTKTPIMEELTMEPVKIGILGIGNEGSMFARRIMAGECPELTLAAVCDRNPARLAWAEENLPGVARFPRAEEMFDRDRYVCLFTKCFRAQNLPL